MWHWAVVPIDMHNGLLQLHSGATTGTHVSMLRHRGWRNTPPPQNSHSSLINWKYTCCSLTCSKHPPLPAASFFLVSILLLPSLPTCSLSFLICSLSHNIFISCSLLYLMTLTCFKICDIAFIFKIFNEYI